MWSLLEKSFSILFLAGSDKVKLSLTVMEYYMVMSHNGDKIPTSNFTECGGKFHQNSQPCLPLAPGYAHSSIYTGLEPEDLSLTPCSTPQHNLAEWSWENPSTSLKNTGED